MKACNVNTNEKVEKLTRLDLKKICKEMILKDLGLFQIRHPQVKIGKEGLVYKQLGKALCSISHTISLATGTTVESVASSSFFKSVLDMTQDLIFHLHSGYSWPTKSFGRVTRNLVDIIFNASLEPDDLRRKNRFESDMSQCFMGIFGTVDDIHLSQYLKEEMLNS
jgi:hypothetical protein